MCLGTDAIAPWPGIQLTGSDALKEAEVDAACSGLSRFQPRRPLFSRYREAAFSQITGRSGRLNIFSGCAGQNVLHESFMQNLGFMLVVQFL